MKKLKLRVGDVFQIPISRELTGYRQTVVNGNVLYITVFEKAYRKEKKVNPHDVVSGKIFLVGHTVDARMYYGMWKVIGNAPVPKDRIPFPCYKVDLGQDGLVVVDFDGNILHAASEKEQALLTFRTTRAPIGFEHALQA